MEDNNTSTPSFYRVKDRITDIYSGDINNSNTSDRIKIDIRFGSIYITYLYIENIEKSQNFPDDRCVTFFHDNEQYLNQTKYLTEIKTNHSNYKDDLKDSIQNFIANKNLEIQKETIELQTKIETATLNNNIRRAVKLVFDKIDSYLLLGKYEDVSQILDGINVNNLDPKVIISFLSVTNTWKRKSKLKKSRDNFLLRTQVKLNQTFGENRTSVILSGLK